LALKEEIMKDLPNVSPSYQQETPYKAFHQPPIRPRRLSYGHESFPIRPERLQTSRRALAELVQGYLDEDGTYPWRLWFHPGTGLPGFMRLRLHRPLAAGDEAALEEAAALLQGQWGPSYRDWSAALFGDPSAFNPSFDGGEIIRLPGGGELGKPAMRHFAWTQSFAGLTVVGGSLRLHEGVHDTRVAVTSSFFPVADGEEDLLAGSEWDEWALRLRVWQALLAQTAGENLNAVFSGLLLTWLASPLAGDRSALAVLLGAPSAEIDALLAFVAGLPGADRLIELLATLLWAPAAQMNIADRLQGYAALVEPVPIRGREQAILPFDGAYHRIRRYRVQLPDADPWYADVDVHSGEVLGGFWQAAAAAPYFRTSGEALAGAPGGDDSHLTATDRTELAGFIANAADLLGSAASNAQRTVAVHALRAYRYLTEVVGVPPARLQGYTRPGGGRQRPGLQVTMSVNPTRFSWGSGDPKTIRLQTADSTAEGKPIVAPANDPEVILHELFHAFLWLFDPEPWDLPGTINPFGRALQEGYAFYLARSLAAQAGSSEADQPWARGAYRPGSWSNRWAPDRSGAIPGADYLPAPNVYPAGLFDAGSNTDVPLYYDVGMVWARALWDLRKLLGAPDTDTLAVRAYPYLHGYIAGFELAAEALIEVDRQELGTLDLGDGTLPIWVHRGIMAGQGIVAFAEAGGILLAGSDAGILRYDGQNWQAETNNLVGGGTLRGVVALAADGIAFYAAAHVPKPTTGGGREWTPGIYRRPAAGGAWQPLGDWVGETGNATPLALWPLAGGGLLAASTKGVFRHTGAAGSTWQVHGGSTGMAMHSLADASFGLRGCSPAELFEGTAGGNWLAEPSRTRSGAFGGSPTERLLRLAVVNDRVFVATLSGLYELKSDWRTVNVIGVSGPVLALAGRGTSLYAAAGNGVFRLAVPAGAAALSAAQALPALTDAVIIALHPAANGTLWAGTQGHGIWRLGNSAWQQAYAPPTPPWPTLAPHRRALLRLRQPQAHPQATLTVQGAGAGSLQILAVGQPGLPLRRVEPDGTGRYNLQAGEVILLVAAGAQSVSITAVTHDNDAIHIQTT
jgi:hypothetical protein